MNEEIAKGVNSLYDSMMWGTVKEMSDWEIGYNVGYSRMLATMKALSTGETAVEDIKLVWQGVTNSPFNEASRYDCGKSAGERMGANRVIWIVNDYEREISQE